MDKNKASQYGFLGAGALFAGFLGWVAFDNLRLDTGRYRVVSTRLPEAWDGTRIVHISDLHQYRHGKHQEKLIAAVRKEKPDYVVITGDLFDPDKDGENAFDLVRGIRDTAPVYYVYGNHEARIRDRKPLMARLREYGVGILNNTSLVLTKNGESIRFAGIIDPSLHKQSRIPEQERVQSYLEKIRPEDGSDPYTVLLSHRPEYFELYCEEKVDLVLCGHTHGGQIRFPFIGALYAPYQGVLPKYANGPFRKGRTVEIISRGLGTSHIPLRVNNPPELCVITLSKEKK